MSRWLFGGLSDPSPGEGEQTGRKLGSRGGGEGQHQPQQSGLISARQAQQQQQQQQQPSPPTRTRESVIVRDLYPAPPLMFHTLDDFCTYDPRDPNKSPGQLDLLFFNGESVTSKLTRLSGWFTGWTGRSANGSYSHTGVAYVGCDQSIGLFESVNSPDSLYDVLGQRPNSSGVRMVSLRERIIAYARKSEIHSEQQSDHSRVVKIGVMKFRIAARVTNEQEAFIVRELVRRFELYQDRVKCISYTQTTRDLCRAQLPQIFGANSSGAADNAMFCSKLACQAYIAVGVLDSKFAADQETPSTLASLTLPFASQFMLGPELYQIYVSVPRDEWDAEIQLAKLHARMAMEARRPPSLPPPSQVVSPPAAAYVPPQALPSPTPNPLPPPAAASPPQQQHHPQQSLLFVDEDDEFQGYRSNEPSLEQLLVAHPTRSEVFQAVEGDDSGFPGEDQFVSAAAEIPPPKEEVFIDPEIERRALEWMDAYRNGIVK